MESLQARFKKEDDVIMLEDDKPPGAYDIGEDIVHEWFLSNYEESPAPNMCIYKRELFKVLLCENFRQKMATVSKYFTCVSHVHL